MKKAAPWVACGLIVAGSLLPVLWPILTSLRTEEAFARSSWGLPWPPTLSNYLQVFREGGFFRYYLNSVLVVPIAATAATFLAASCGYAFARARAKWVGALFYFFLAGMMVPPHVALIPLRHLMRAIGVFNTLPALFFPYVAFGLPVSILIFRGFFAELPRELEEAARIDGAGELRIFLEVSLPLSAPAAATVWILNFVTMWNEYAFALALIDSPRSMTLPLGLDNFVGPYESRIPVLCAGICAAVIPAFLAYAFAQRHVIRGLTAGALK